ncbi:IPExxxVDY family protein [Candidatus Sulfidibacterium hydrothermale]|uniref:IPExxxVDY family protein n=1 Tax=Candidatus Sulfidibacterium hydrothermale TaxID=2875962 RepID=UPI001F0A5484|nr:IPExxxVDY family protein [Candidatus Sulfidibacterium hydrothermale]UBM62345.1 IPExxxVDY family protein [Candidatus Sulfidibacterium hydrothermale]
MAKKQFIESNFFEGYRLIGIVCGLPDFRLSHFINREIGLALKKHQNFSLSEDQKPVFSWYFYHQEEQHRQFFLIQNKNKAELLLPSLNNFDYLLLTYGNFSDATIEELLQQLRRIPYITAAYEQDLAALKQGDLLIARNEQHTTADSVY